MAQSPEYPDLPWVPPRSWANANRADVQFIVIHTTEGHEEASSAEDGAAYDARRTDGTSTHYFHDRDSTVQCVRTEDIAYAARRQGNRRGIQHELCGKAGQGATGWADAASQGTLRQAAKQCARDAHKWGIPVRRPAPSGVAAGQKGFCGHADVTLAFPQDDGDHTDPGLSFPWQQFLGMVKDELTALEGDEMTTPAQNWTHDVDPSAGTYSAGGALWTVLGRTGLLNTLSGQVQGIVAALEDADNDLDALGASLALIASGLNQLLADPADVGPGHPLVAAVAYYFDEVAPNGPAAQG